MQNYKQELIFFNVSLFSANEKLTDVASFFEVKNLI
jgi:hypothetical protein